MCDVSLQAAENLAMLSNLSSIMVTLHQIEGLSMDASLVFREWQLRHTRIIVGLFRPLEARRVLCQVRSGLGMCCKEWVRHILFLLQ